MAGMGPFVLGVGDAVEVGVSSVRGHVGLGRVGVASRPRVHGGLGRFETLNRIEQFVGAEVDLVELLYGVGALE